MPGQVVESDLALLGPAMETMAAMESTLYYGTAKFVGNANGWNAYTFANGTTVFQSEGPHSAYQTTAFCHGTDLGNVAGLPGAASTDAAIGVCNY